MAEAESLLGDLLVSLLTVAALLAFLVGLKVVLNRIPVGVLKRTINRQLIMMVATLLAVFLLIVLMPINESLRGQILGLLGILLSAAIALSATSFLGNALAGIQLRSLRSFRTGDFIYINDKFGRVSGHGLFHIEIQTEDRDLMTLPNLYVTNNPVKVVRESGTIVSSEVSLGYDVPRDQIEELLKEAADESGLDAPFVHIRQLGDSSVLYRVSGMLTDVKQLLSARSRLNGVILDTFHGAGIEIVSPTFMNTRDVAGRKFIGRSRAKGIEAAGTQEPEEIIFDKAEQAATLEERKASLTEVEKRIEILETALGKAEDDKKARISATIERLRQQQSELTCKIAIETKAMEKEKQGE